MIKATKRGVILIGKASTVITEMTMAIQYLYRKIEQKDKTLAKEYLRALQMGIDDLADLKVYQGEEEEIEL